MSSSKTIGFVVRGELFAKTFPSHHAHRFQFQRSSSVSKYSYRSTARQIDAAILLAVRLHDFRD